MTQTSTVPSAEQIRSALEEASIPVLLSVLVQLTGDRKWLREPFTCEPPGLEDPLDGGLSAEAQEVVRQSALAVLANHFEGPAPASIEPPEDLVTEMMTASVGERVGPEYAPMMLEEIGFRSRDIEWRDRPFDERIGEFRVLIVGAGVSGILAAAKLGRLGIPYDVVEKNGGLGGTWYENRYPACGVDTPSHLYSYSFERNFSWSEYFSKRDELQEYFESFAERAGVTPNIRFNTELVEASFDEQSSTWIATLRDPEGQETALRANAVITAVGQLNRPRVPDIPGAESFLGPSFHSARWPDGLAVDGRRVAIVGSGASAMQIVPAIVDAAEKVTIFQRSPQWALPVATYFQRVTEQHRWLMEHVPYYEKWYRFRQFWRFGDSTHASLKVDPDWPHPERALNESNDSMRRMLTEYIQSQLGDRQDLLADVLPTYPPFGKRMLIDNGWYRTIARDDVELVSDGLARIEQDAIVTQDGTVHRADVIVYATGFEANRILWPMRITGRGGLRLSELWGEDDPRAYLGMTVPQFPNLFCMYGPNTNLAHGGSLIFNSECQVRYITALLREMIEKEIAALECRQDVHDRYNAEVDAAHEQLVWAHRGMSSWYKNRAGRVVANSPWRLVDYWSLTREPNLDDFMITSHATATAGATEGSSS